MDVLSSIQFYLITPSSLADIRKFIKDNELSKFSNMVVALDYQGFFMKYINNASVPLTAIYNDKRNFVVAYVGNIDAVLLKQIVSK